LRQLTAAPRTRAQLDQALARRGVPDDVTDDLLDRLEEVGLVDDQEYARMWVESRHAGRGLSRRALRYELAQRGVDPDLVRTAVEVVDDDAELAAATALARRRLSGMRDPDPQRRDRRLLAMLARRGYGAGTATRALRTALAGVAIESPESSELVESIEMSEPDDLE
jgi:regulatory protein